MKSCLPMAEDPAAGSQKGQEMHAGWMRAHRQRVVCVSIQRAALINLMLQGQGKDQRDVVRMLQLYGVHPEGYVLPLSCCPAPSPCI